MNWIDNGPRDNWDEIDTPNTTRAYWAGEIGLENATESTAGGRKVKFRLIRGPADQATINPFAKSTLRRGKRAGARFQLSAVPVMGAGPGPGMLEVMLLAWADGPHGSTVTLMLDQEGDHPFMPMAHGDRLMAAFAEIGDDDTIIDESALGRGEAAAGAASDFDTKTVTAVVRETHCQKLSNQAAILVKNQAFAIWLCQDRWPMDQVIPKVEGESPANTALKLLCGIGSKSELDANEVAAERFVALRYEFNSRPV